MNLSEPFIRKPVMTTLAAFSAAVFGIAAYLTMPVSDLPDVAYPVIEVSTSYPGASPQIMADNVATPLEIEMMQIQGLQMIRSSNTLGSSSITLQFALDKSLTEASTDVQAAIQRAMGNLPADLPSPPSYKKTNPNEQPIIYIAVTTDNVAIDKLYDYANNFVGQQLSTLTGVSQVDVYGAPRAVRIEVDPNALASRSLAMTDVAEAVADANPFIPGGQLYGPHLQNIVNPKGQLLEAKDYEDVIITYRDGAPVRIRDVARPYNGLEAEFISMKYWVRGAVERDANIVVAVTPAPGANSVEVSRLVRQQLDVIRPTIPASIELSVVYDRSLSIIASIDDVKGTLVIAFALVILVIFLSLGRVRETLVPAFALPMALLLTFVAISALGYSLDNLSLMALTLAVGFLVDDAIVVVENTVRHLDMGKGPLAAAIAGAQEISFTVLSMTLSLSAVFIPLVFMPGLMGRMFHEFAMTIVIAILMSGLVAITLSPMMCSRLFKPLSQQKTGRFEKGVNAVFGFLRKEYGRAVRFSLRHKFLVLLLWLAMLAGTVFLVLIIPKIFMPVGDSGTLKGVLMAREGTSSREMVRMQAQVEDVLRAIPIIDRFVVVTGFTSADISSSMMIFWCELIPSDRRHGIDKASKLINGALYEEIPGLMPLIRPVPTLEISTGATSNQQGQYAYSMLGTDSDTLYAAAEQMIEELSQTKGFIQVSSDLRLSTPFLDVEILRDQASTYGISAKQIEETLRYAYSGGRVSQIKTPLNQYDVIVETSLDYRSSSEDLGTLWVRSDVGNTDNVVPLASVADWTQTVGPESVNHLQQLTAVNIYYDLLPGFPDSEAQQALDALAAKILPQGVTGRSEGTARQFEETIRSLMLLLVVAVFVMYIILGILYESYIHPVTVLSALPPAGVGGLLSLFLLGMPLSLYAFIGLFLLIGLVKKNAIMVVDFAIQRRNQGMALDAAVIEACQERLRPILMTTAAAIFGALPIALGLGADGSSRQPLGVCIVGGLIVSQLITLFVTPVFYVYMEGFQERFLDRIPFFQRELKDPVTPEKAKS